MLLEKSTQRTYKMVDLFCGCGGISRGFAWTGRFATEFGVEIEKHPSNAFAFNIRDSRGNPTHVFQGDISNLTSSDTTLWSELKKANITSAGQVDVLVGGPPCQGFSRNGTRKYMDGTKKDRFYDDPRNHLYRSFLSILGAIDPKLVLIENVREFLSFGNGKFSEDLLKKLDELGYYAIFKKVCAADYGVPQVRHRVLFIAIKKEIMQAAGITFLFPEPTFSESRFRLPGMEDLVYRTVSDAIRDLPNPVLSHKESPQLYDNNKNISAYAMQMRARSGLLYNHVARVLSPLMIERIRAVGSGRMRDISPELKTESFYGSAYGRLIWDEPSLTITTWVYHVGSGRFAHPSQDRAITMREAARIQSFDDDFVFPPLINPVSQMIGNAVPPMLANAIAKKFVEILDKVENVANQQKNKVDGYDVINKKENL